MCKRGISFQVVYILLLKTIMKSYAKKSFFVWDSNVKVKANINHECISTRVSCKPCVF